VVAAAVTAAWVSTWRGWAYGSLVFHSQVLTLGVQQGQCSLLWLPVRAGSQTEVDGRWYEPADTDVAALTRYHWNGFGVGEAVGLGAAGWSWMVVAPGWCLSLLFLLPPMIWLKSRRSRANPQSCPACGYDLRGSERKTCPECGAPHAGNPRSTSASTRT
jgi:hypothetical protein